MSSSSHRHLVHTSTVQAAAEGLLTCWPARPAPSLLSPSRCAAAQTRHDPMSLFSSFIIEPVVRHARRFSGVVAPSEASDNGRRPEPPLACDNHDSPPNPRPHRDTAPGATTPGARQENIAHADPAARPTAPAGPFGRFSSLSQPPHSAAVATDEERHDRHRLVEMSTNPSHPLAEQFRRLQVDAEPSQAPRPASIASQNAVPASEALPADDGMAHLRMRIHEIRALDISDQERARMVHNLMTEKYNFMRPTSPASLVSHDRPFTPASGESLFSEVHASSPYSSTSDADLDAAYNLREGDTRPTYRPQHHQHSAEQAEEDEDDVAEGEFVLGCQHYKRNVKVQCFECRRWYTCRHCHDAVEDHNLNRKMTQHMLCMACGTPQKASDTCKNCETQAACYYCDICKLWDNNSKKKIYHCPDCGICRRGEGLGKDFYHCKVSPCLEPVCATLTTMLRVVTSACPFPMQPHTSACHAQLKVIAPSAVTTSSPHLLLLSQCPVAIICTKAATTSTCRLRTNVPYARRAPCAWTCSGRN